MRSTIPLNTVCKESSFRGLALRLVLPQLSNENLDSPFGLALLPILKTRTDPDSEKSAVSAETQRRYAGRIPLVLPDSPLRHAVPQRDKAISTARCKGAVHGMESQRIDRVDDIDTVLARLPMALEGVFARLGRFGRIEPFDGDAAFDTGGGVPGVVGHAGNGAGHEFQRALPPLPRLRRQRRIIPFPELLSGHGGSGVRSEGREVVDLQRARGHGHDEFGGGEGNRERFGGKFDCRGGCGGRR